MNKENFIKFKGKLRGTKSIVIGGVHGDEYFGVLAVQEIVNEIQTEKIIVESGSVTFGFGNMRAIEGRVRLTETNLNRMFKDKSEYSKLEKKSYEYKRAQVIKKYLKQNDVLLDVHGSYTKDSKSFLICEKNSKDISKFLGVQDIVYGFDIVEPGGTDYYMNKMGKIGICVECGYLGDEEICKNVAKQVIINFLIKNGNISGQVVPTENVNYLQMYKKYYAKSDNFKLQKYFKDFERVKKGQIIGIDEKTKVAAVKNGFILFAGDGKKKGDECFLLGM